MDKLIKKHFSLSDWEFEAGHRYYISTAYSISPPSSLATPAAGGTLAAYYCYLKDTLAPNVPDGRFIASHFRAVDGIIFVMHFRRQPPLAPGNPKNGYTLYYESTSAIWQLRLYVNGSYYLKGQRPAIPYTPGTWLRLRFDFYQYITETTLSVLRVAVFYEAAGEWVSLGYIDDTENKFATSASNRIGFCMQGWYRDDPSFMDDTEIWKKI